MKESPDYWLADAPSAPLTEPELKFIDWLCDEAVKEWVAEHVAQRANAGGLTEIGDGRRPSRPAKRIRTRRST